MYKDSEGTIHPTKKEANEREAEIVSYRDASLIRDIMKGYIKLALEVLGSPGSAVIRQERNMAALTLFHYLKQQGLLKEGEDGIDFS
jgi:hypothetical protein